MALEFSERVRRIPVYPAAGAYALPEDVALLASNESPDPPLPAVVEAVSAVLGGLNRYPDPTNAKLRRALSDRYDVPAARIAIGNGSCDILLAAGEALLEPGAELVYAWPSFSVYPHLAAASGATAITVALNDRDEHDLDAMAQRDHRRDAAGHRLQPQQPDVDRGVRRRGRGLRRARAAARLRDRRRGLLRVQHARRPRHDARSAQAPPPTSCCCGRSRRSTGCAGCASATRCAAPTSFVTAVNQVRQPFFCNAAAQAAAIEALKHQDAVASRVERTIVARVELEDGLRELGIEPADSQANFCWFDLPVADGEEPAEVEAASSPGSASAACSCAPARPSAAPARCASPTAPRRRTRASCASWAPFCRRLKRGSRNRLSLYVSRNHDIGCAHPGTRSFTESSTTGWCERQPSRSSSSTPARSSASRRWRAGPTTRRSNGHRPALHRRPRGRPRRRG